MAERTPDASPDNWGTQNPEADIKDSREVSPESASAATGKVRPADLGLIRSLSKSDSDLLASPLGEEDGGLAGRSGSVSNCSSGQPSMERMPSFASEWDEVILELWGWETSGRVKRTEGVALLVLRHGQAFKLSVLMSLIEGVQVRVNV